MKYRHATLRLFECELIVGERPVCRPAHLGDVTGNWTVQFTLHFLFPEAKTPALF